MPFNYEEYLKLPLFMIRDIQEYMDEIIRQKEEYYKSVK